MLEKEEVRSFYDRMWSQYDRGLNRHERQRFGAIMSVVEGLSRPNQAILDAGCGLGKLSACLAHYGDVTAVEWSSKAVEAARERVPEARLITADLVRDDLAALTGRFGLAVCSEVLEHVGRENRLTLARKLAACLASGGYLILTTPNKAISERISFPVVGRPSMSQSSRPEAWIQPEDDLLTTQETLAVIQETGLTVLLLRSATVLERLWERSSTFRRMRSWLPLDRLGRDPLDRLLAPTRLGLYDVILARVSPA